MSEQNAIITLKKPLNKPGDMILKAGNYLFEVTKFEGGATKKDKKQAIRVSFKCIEDGEYKGATMPKFYSIEDDAGANEFGQLVLAIKGPKSLDTPMTAVNPVEFLGKKLFLALSVVERDDGKGKANEVTRGGYTPFEGGAAATGTPAAATENKAAASTDEWDK